MWELLWLWSSYHRWPIYSTSQAYMMVLTKKELKQVSLQASQMRSILCLECEIYINLFFSPLRQFLTLKYFKTIVVKNSIYLMFEVKMLLNKSWKNQWKNELCIWVNKCIRKDSKLFAYGVHQMQFLTHSYYFHSIFMF